MVAPTVGARAVAKAGQVWEDTAQRPWHKWLEHQTTRALSPIPGFENAEEAPIGISGIGKTPKPQKPGVIAKSVADIFAPKDFPTAMESASFAAQMATKELPWWARLGIPPLARAVGTAGTKYNEAPGWAALRGLEDAAIIEGIGKVGEVAGLGEGGWLARWNEARWEQKLMGPAGEAVKKGFPDLFTGQQGKEALYTARSWEDEFGLGDRSKARLRAAENLDNVVNKISSRLWADGKNRIELEWRDPLSTNQPYSPHFMQHWGEKPRIEYRDFKNANEAVSRGQRFGYRQLSGEMKEGIPAATAAQEAADQRVSIEQQLIRMGYPALAKEYKAARSQYDGIATLTDALDPKKFSGQRWIETRGHRSYLKRDAMIDRIQANRNALVRAWGFGDDKLGDAKVDAVIEAFRAGSKEAGYPKRSKPRAPGRVTFIAHAVPFSKAQYEAVPATHVPGSKLPWHQDFPSFYRDYVRPILGAGWSNLRSGLGEHPVTDIEKGVSRIKRHARERAREMAPSPSASPTPAKTGMNDLNRAAVAEGSPGPSGVERGVKILAKATKGGKPPDISRDLSSGRLSRQETKQILTMASEHDANKRYAHVPMHELLNAAEMAGPEEKPHLVQLAQQRMPQEMARTQNMTEKMSHGRRLERLTASTRG